MSKSYPTMSYSAAHKWEAEAKKRGVSKVARSQRGFMRAYQRAGSFAKLPQSWKDKRRAFIARHMAQARSEDLWKGGKPSRRALALIMWAYMPPGRSKRNPRLTPGPGAPMALEGHNLPHGLPLDEAVRQYRALERKRMELAKRATGKIKAMHLRVAKQAKQKADGLERMLKKAKTNPGRVCALTGLPLNKDGTVTIYHHTSADAARKIKQTGRLKAQAEPDVYVTTRKTTDTGYGDTAVALKVDPSRLLLDDEFPDGRLDFRMYVGRPGGSIPVQVASLPKRNPRTLAGGLGDRLRPSQVNQRELKMGIKVEMEHTHDRKLAREIALDHLAEYPDYYTRLAKMEREADRAMNGRRSKNPKLKFGTSTMAVALQKTNKKGVFIMRHQVAGSGQRVIGIERGQVIPLSPYFLGGDPPHLFADWLKDHDIKPVGDWIW